MEWTAPREASGVIVEDTSRTGQTSCFKSHQGALPSKLSVKLQFFLPLFMINRAGNSFIDHYGSN